MRARQETRLIQTQKLRLNMSLATSIRVLQFDASGLTRYLAEQAEANPCLTLLPPPLTDWLPRWTTAFATGESGNGVDWLAEAPTGLIGHVGAQIDRLVPAGRPRQIAQILLQALEPSGWLGQSPEALAREEGIRVAELRAVLARLQQAEPTGLFAESLADCLRLQAEEAGCLDTVMSCLLKHLDLLAAGEITRLATMCAVDSAEILRVLRLIRSFDPKPGAQFTQGAAPMREPDLVAVKDAEGWHISLNRSALPELRITARDGSRSDLAAARATLRLLNSRNATLLRVGQHILARQQAALEVGAEGLVPMTMAGIGAELELHESTVSRCIAGVSVDTPRGTWWLRALFSTGRSAAADTVGPAAAAIRARLARLVAAESRAKPLSDRALTDALTDAGMPLARRTVAKYREMLGIAPAHRRRVKVA